MGVINFVEQKRQVHIYDYLVYVCGVEVSRYIADLSINYQDRTGQGSADIILTNPFDQWIMRTPNLIGKFRLTGDRYSETPKQRIWARKKTRSIQLVLKNNVEVPLKYIGPVPPPDGSVQDPDFEAALREATDEDFLKRYSFGPGSCIFSRFDTVKIFIKNPYDPPGADRWFPAFTGTVENKPFPTDYVMGTSTVSLHCYDIKATMAGMRVNVNPYQNASYQPGNGNAGAQRAQTTIFDSDAAGFFKDFYPTAEDLTRRSPFDNIFAGLSFVDSISMITTGSIGWVNGGKATPNGSGVGFFSPGLVQKYAAPGNGSITESGIVTNLESWDNICLFGTDSTGQQVTGFWSKKECDDVGNDSFWTGNNTPLHGQVHFLIPAEGLEVADMIRSSLSGTSNIMASPDWTNRFALVSQICGTLDYEWNISGSGDMIFEFPMYDFYPQDFGSNKTIYTVDKHAESDEISDEGGEMISALEGQSVSSDFAQSKVQETFHGTAQGVAVEGTMRAVALSNTLASKIGARIANKTFTGIKDVKALQKITMLDFQKRLADANKLSLNFSYRPFLRPNRPLLHKTRERLGRISSVRLSMPSLRACSISVGLNCVRTPLFKMNPQTGKNEVYYQHVMGGASMALSYNSLYEKPTSGDKPPGDTDSGINIRSATTKDNQ